MIAHLFLISWTDNTLMGWQWPTHRGEDEPMN